MTQMFNVIIEKGMDGYLLSDVVELPWCHTQARTMDELMERTRDAITIYLDVKIPEIMTTFIGIKKTEI